MYGQVTCCWAESEGAGQGDRAPRLAERRDQGATCRRSRCPGQTAQAAQNVTPDDLAEAALGPGAAALRRAGAAYVDAGFDHVYFHQIGRDQDGFFRFWQEELAPALAGAVASADR